MTESFEYGSKINASDLSEHNWGDTFARLR